MAEDKDKNLPVKGGNPLEPEQVINLMGVQLDKERMYRGGGGEEEPEGGGAGFSLRDILYTLFRHKWKIVVIFLLSSVATVFYVSIQPQLFGSEARVLIRGDRAGVEVDPSGEGNSILKGGREGIHARTEIGIMQGMTLAERVVDQLGPEAVLGWEDKPAPRPGGASTGWFGRLVQRSRSQVMAVVDAAAKWLKLTNPPLTPRLGAIKTIAANLDVAPTMSDSMVLKVTYASYSPESARKILDTLLDNYLQQHIEIHKTQVSPEFFKDKIKLLKDQLTQKENELEQARKRLKISSLDNQKTLLLSQFNTFDTAMRENSAQINASRAKIQLMEEMLRRRPEAIKKLGGGMGLGISPLTEQLRTRLLDLRLKEADLATRFTPQAPALRDVRNQIKETEQMISGQKPEAYGGIMELDPRRTDMEMQVQLARAELEAQNAREGALTKEVTALRREIDTLASHEKELHGLEREVALLETEYRQYTNSLQVSETSSALDRDKISNVCIVQSATLPTETVKSKRKLLALMGFGIFLGLAAGIGWAFVLDYCNHSIKTSDDIEKGLGLPVLMTLPHMRHHKAELQEDVA